MKSRCGLVLVSMAVVTVVGAARTGAQDSCRELSGLMPDATAAQAGCVAEGLEANGYALADAEGCIDMKTAADWRACLGRLDVSGEHCQALRGRCLETASAPQVLVDEKGVKVGDAVTVDESGVRVGDQVTVDESGVRVGDQVTVDESGVRVGDLVTVNEAGVSVGSIVHVGTGKDKKRRPPSATARYDWQALEGAHPEPPEGLRPSKPVVCDGDADMEISGRYIDTEGDGVLATDNCTMEIRDSFIVAGQRGVVADENADVTLVNCFVQGLDGAVEAMDNAEVDGSGNLFRGGVSGDFSDDGHNIRQPIPEE